MAKIKDSDKLKQIVELLFVEAHKFDNEPSIPIGHRTSYGLFNYLHFNVDYAYRTKRYKVCWMYIRGHVNMLEKYNICTIDDIPEGITEFISINCYGEMSYRGETYADKNKVKIMRNYSSPTQKMILETRYGESGSESTVLRLDRFGDVSHRTEYNNDGETIYSYTYSPKSIISTVKLTYSKDGREKSITVYDGEDTILSEEYYVNNCIVDRKEYCNGKLISKEDEQ